MPRRKIDEVSEDGATAYRVQRYRTRTDDETSVVETVLIAEDVLTLGQIDQEITKHQNRKSYWQDTKARILQMQTDGDITADDPY